MSVQEIYNYLEIEENLATSGQPTEEQIADIAAAGFGVVVNLALPTSTNALPDEASTARTSGLAYHSIPVIFESPQLDDFERFCSLMDALSGQKVWVHCVANWRVSTFVSLYGELRRGWTREQADELRLLFWESDKVWDGFVQTLRDSFTKE
jgi:protein tyrosine phosphatase (PTP) superfamily phosphohydrolase (DUF442 family)